MFRESMETSAVTSQSRIKRLYIVVIKVLSLTPIQQFQLAFHLKLLNIEDEYMTPDAIVLAIVSHCFKTQQFSQIFQLAIKYKV